MLKLANCWFQHTTTDKNFRSEFWLSNFSNQPKNNKCTFDIISQDELASFFVLCLIDYKKLNGVLFTATKPTLQTQSLKWN
jgi:hypothetical protein